MADQPIRIRILVHVDGEVRHDIILPADATIAEVRNEIGESALALVDSESGNVLADSMLLSMLVSSKGELHLDLLPGVVPRAGAASEPRKTSFTDRVLGLLTTIGFLTIVYFGFKAFHKFKAWRENAKSPTVSATPAPAPGVAPASPPPAAPVVAPAAAAPAAQPPAPTH
jgi:hypothetical protein